MTEAERLARWASGDTARGQELFDEYLPVLLRFLRNKVQVQDVEELVQRTFAVLVERHAQYRGDGTIRAFMLGIARVELLRHFRERRNQAERELDFSEISVADLDPSPSQILAATQEHRLLLAALRRIPVELQIVIELHYWEHLSMAEIGEILDVPEGTAKSRLRRARERVREAIERLSTHPELVTSTLSDLDGWAGSLRGAVQAG